MPARHCGAAARSYRTSEGHDRCANSSDSCPCCTAGCRRHCRWSRCSWRSAPSIGAGGAGVSGHYRSALIAAAAVTALSYWYIAFDRGGRRPGAGVAVAVDRDERAGRRRAVAGLAAAPAGGGAGVAVLSVPLCVLCASARVERVGRLFPHGAHRVEPADRRAAARPDRSAAGHRNAGRGDQAEPRASWCR